MQDKQSPINVAKRMFLVMSIVIVVGIFPYSIGVLVDEHIKLNADGVKTTGLEFWLAGFLTELLGLLVGVALYYIIRWIKTGK